jgi:hypothetical protein
VAGPRPIYTALPHFPGLQIEESVYGASARVSTKGAAREPGSTIFPIGLALFDQGAQAFLGILKAIEFIEENVHGILEAVA